jgi:hypothetical protein
MEAADTPDTQVGNTQHGDERQSAGVSHDLAKPVVMHEGLIMAAESEQEEA